MTTSPYRICISRLDMSKPTIFHTGRYYLRRRGCKDNRIGTPQLMDSKAGQIIATSHGSLTPNGGLVREIPLFQGNLGW